MGTEDIVRCAYCQAPIWDNTAQKRYCPDCLIENPALAGEVEDVWVTVAVQGEITE